MEVSINTSVSHTASHPVTFFEEVANGVFHEDVNPFVDAAFLQRADDFEPRGVADVSQTREGVTAEVPLVDQVLWCAVENGAPLFELTHSVGGFFGVVFCHSPVCEPLAALHGVVEVNLPAVSRVGVGECCGTTALGHDRVCFPEQRFGDDGRFRTASCGFDGGTQSGPTRTDDDHIVFVVGNVLVHRLTSNGKEHHVVQPPLCDQQDPDVAEEYKG